jgi:hypothetical protein
MHNVNLYIAVARNNLTRKVFSIVLHDNPLSSGQIQGGSCIRMFLFSTGILDSSSALDSSSVDRMETMVNSVESDISETMTSFGIKQCI